MKMRQTLHGQKGQKILRGEEPISIRRGQKGTREEKEPVFGMDTGSCGCVGETKKGT